MLHVFLNVLGKKYKTLFFPDNLIYLYVTITSHLITQAEGCRCHERIINDQSLEHMPHICPQQHAQVWKKCIHTVRQCLIYDKVLDIFANRSNSNFAATISVHTCVPRASRRVHKHSFMQCFCEKIWYWKKLFLKWVVWCQIVLSTWNHWISKFINDAQKF